MQSSTQALQDGFVDYLKKHELKNHGLDFKKPKQVKPSIETEIAEIMRKESKN